MSNLYQDDLAPEWFISAVNTPYQDKFIEVEGAKIHYQHWKNEGEKPGLLFVHGGGAHSHWWDFIAPSFLADYDVAALDISGMGDSDHRESYSPAQFSRELMAVCDDVGFGKDKIIAAHSFGGLATLRAGLDFADQLKGIVMIDSALFPPNFKADNDMKGSPFNQKRVYPDLAAGLQRFKLVPPQPCENDYILRYIARHSIGEVEGGWSWKFDMKFLQKTEMDSLTEDLPNLKAKTTVMYGQKSMLFLPALVEFMKTQYPSHVPFVEVPDAAHHVFLDQPLGFIEQFRDVLKHY